MACPSAALTWSALASYGGRKRAGRISILVDTTSGDVHLVPRNIEHIDYVAQQLFKTEDYDEIRERAQPLIPSHIEVIINPETGREEVTSIHTGDSGLEIRYGVRHPEKALLRGHQRALEYARRGEIPVSETLDEKNINKKYAHKNRRS